MEDRYPEPYKSEICCLKSLDQQAKASASASQFIDQLNYNKQFAALAYAETGSTAIAVQRASHENKNMEESDSAAENTASIEDVTGGYNSYEQCCDDINQRASSIIGQNQHASQDNANIQGIIIKKGSKLGRVENIVQYSEHFNKNTQDAYSKALNYEKAREISSYPADAPSEEAADLSSSIDSVGNDILGIPNDSDLKLTLTVSQGGREMFFETDGKGGVVYDEKDSAGEEDIAASPGIGGCCVKIALSLEGQSYEIFADENDNIFINGHKMDLSNLTA